MEDKKLTLDRVAGRAPKGWIAAMGVAGLLALATAIVIPVVNVKMGPGTAGDWWKWLYAGGALLFLAAKLFSPYTGEVMRVKRLYRIESWSAVFFCVAAFFLFYNGGVGRDCWAFTLAGGVILVFTTIQIPRTVNKIMKEGEREEKKN